MIDLHTHTTASDGTYRPSELVKMARDKGLQAIAITDHDTTAGNREALEAGKKYGIEIISGVEISADSPFGSVHLVGLLIDLNSDSLETTLKELREYRAERNRKLIIKLADLGIEITIDELLKEAGDDLVGRPHFAALLVKKGVVASHQEAFNKYLGAGAKAYLDKKRLPVDKAVKMIRDSGGIAIFAHPYTTRKKDEDGFEDNLRYLIERGLQGIEVFYTEHTGDEEAFFGDLARRYNLFISGGTDFHGAIKPDIELGVGFGSMNISYEYLEIMKEAVS